MDGVDLLPYRVEATPGLLPDLLAPLEAPGLQAAFIALAGVALTGPGRLQVAILPGVHQAR